MPNTAVKPANAESTWGEAPWEDRKPLIKEKSTGKFQCFFYCSLLVVRGSWEMRGFLSDQGSLGFVGAVPKGGPPRINGDIHNRSMRHGFTSHEPRTTSHGFFLGFRCGVPPRQTQADNIASSNPPLVKTPRPGPANSVFSAQHFAEFP